MLPATMTAASEPRNWPRPNFRVTRGHFGVMGSPHDFSKIVRQQRRGQEPSACTVASAAFIASGAVALVQENPRHEEKPAASSEARPSEASKAESREALRAAQTNERSEKGNANEGAQRKMNERPAQTGQLAEPEKREGKTRTGQTMQREKRESESPTGQTTQGEKREAGRLKAA